MTADTSPEGAKPEALPDLPMAWGWAQTFAGEDAPVLRGGYLSDGQSVYTAAQMRYYAESATRAMHAKVQELERELSSIGAGGVEPLRQRGACWVPVAERLPEPGTPVLLDIGKRLPIRAMWAAKHTVEAPPEQVDIDWGDYDETTDTYYSPEGWYEWNAHEECHWFVHDAPRAWMALPEQDRARGAQGESNAE